MELELDAAKTRQMSTHGRRSDALPDDIFFERGLIRFLRTRVCWTLAGWKKAVGEYRMAGAELFCGMVLRERWCAKSWPARENLYPKT